MAESRNCSANITGSFWKRILTQYVKRFMGYMGIYCYGRTQTMLHCGTIYLKIRIIFSDMLAIRAEIQFDFRATCQLFWSHFSQNVYR